MFMGLHPNALFTSHVGQAGGRGISPRLWSHTGGQDMSPDGLSNAFLIGDDFLNFGTLAPSASGTTAGLTGGYGYYVDTTTTAANISSLATMSGGGIEIGTGARDANEAWLTTGGNTGVLGAISDTAGSDKLTIFETRIRFPVVADNYNAFIGLAEEGLAAADTIPDDASTNYIADKDHIGFMVNESDGDNLMFVYNKAGAGATNQTTIKIAVLQALTLNTWYKVGFIYNPKADASKRITIYVDNEEESTYVTATNIATATFPDGEELAFLAGLKANAATDIVMDVDWWGFYQEG